MYKKPKKNENGKIHGTICEKTRPKIQEDRNNESEGGEETLVFIKEIGYN
jgi:hypothetical protein